MSEIVDNSSGTVKNQYQQHAQCPAPGIHPELLPAGQFPLDFDNLGYGVGGVAVNGVCYVVIDIYVFVLVDNDGIAFFTDIYAITLKYAVSLMLGYIDTIMPDRFNRDILNALAGSYPCKSKQCDNNKNQIFHKQNNKKAMNLLEHRL